MAGGSASSSKSKNSSGNQFSQDVWGPQGNALQDLYGQMSSLFGNTNQGMQSQIPGAVDHMQGITNDTKPFWEQQMQGGAYKDMGIQDQLMGSLNQSMNSPSAMSEINGMIMGGNGNNYADAMKNTYLQDATKAQNNMMSNLDARAAASGMSGGSRHGIATAQGMEGINQNLQANMANTGFNTFDKDLDRKLQIAGQADQGTLARQQMMQQMLGQQQGAMQGGMQFGQNMQNLGMGAFAPYMAPWQAAGSYANAIGGPTVLGSGTSNSSGSSKGGGAGAKFSPPGSKG